MRTTDENNNVYRPEGPVVPIIAANESASSSDLPDGAEQCGNGRVRCFSPTFYAIDTVIPLVDLHQRSTWHPDRATPYGRHYEWGLNSKLKASHSRPAPLDGSRVITVLTGRRYGTPCPRGNVRRDMLAVLLHSLATISTS